MAQHIHQRTFHPAGVRLALPEAPAVMCRRKENGQDSEGEDKGTKQDAAGKKKRTRRIKTAMKGIVRAVLACAKKQT